MKDSDIWCRVKAKVQEELQCLPEDLRKIIIDRRAGLAEKYENIKSPEEMLADIDARCKVLKESGMYDPDKIEQELKNTLVEANKIVDQLLGRTSK